MPYKNPAKRKANRHKRYRAAVEAGRCADCPQPADPWSVRCTRCNVKRRFSGHAIQERMAYVEAQIKRYQNELAELERIVREKERGE